MTPQKKAQDLFEEMRHHVIKSFGCEVGLSSDGAGKKCAILCCDEILSVLEKADEDRGRKEEFRPLEEYDYWTQVKEHIQSI